MRFLQNIKSILPLNKCSFFIWLFVLSLVTALPSRAREIQIMEGKIVGTYDYFADGANNKHGER